MIFPKFLTRRRWPRKYYRSWLHWLLDIRSPSAVARYGPPLAPQDLKELQQIAKDKPACVKVPDPGGRTTADLVIVDEWHDMGSAPVGIVPTEPPPPTLARIGGQATGSHWLHSYIGAPPAVSLANIYALYGLPEKAVDAVKAIEAPAGGLFFIGMNAEAFAESVRKLAVSFACMRAGSRVYHLAHHGRKARTRKKNHNRALRRARIRAKRRRKRP